MHGPLNEIGLIEVLQLLGRGERSGTLRVVGVDVNAPRTLRIHNGQVVAIDPDAGDAAVGRSLAKRHLVPGNEGAQISFDPEYLEALRDTLARRALGSLMQWDTGRFDFDEGDTEPGPLAWSPEALVLSLVADESRRVELQDEFGGWGAVPTFCSAEELAGGESIRLEPVDWRILDAVDGVRDVAGVAARLDESLETVGERLQLLEAAAILQLCRPPEDVTEGARLATGAGRYEDVIAQLRVRVVNEPADAEAWHSLGLAEIGVGRFDRAIEAWQAWEEAAPAGSGEARTLIEAATTMMEALRENRD